MREGGDEVVTGSNATNFQGEIWLTGAVRKRSRANGSGKFNEVRVAGPFKSSKIRLGSIVSNDREFFEMTSKFGYQQAHYVSSAVATLLYCARYNPGAIRNLQAVKARRGVEIWLPFHSYEPQYHGISARTIVEGPQPNFQALTVDTLVQFLTRGSKTKHDLNKALTRLPVIYDKLLLQLINRGDANFVTIADKWILNRSGPSVPPPQYAWYDAMDKHLIARGYHFEQLVLEKKDTPFETVAMDYKSRDGNKSIRLLFFNGLPPLVQERVLIPKHKTEVFLMDQKSQKDPIHPYAALFDSYEAELTPK